MMVNLPEGNRRGDFSRIISNTLLANLTNIGVISTSNKVVGYFFFVTSKTTNKLAWFFFFCCLKNRWVVFCKKPIKVYPKKQQQVGVHVVFFFVIPKKNPNKLVLWKIKSSQIWAVKSHWITCYRSFTPLYYFFSFNTFTNFLFFLSLILYYHDRTTVVVVFFFRFVVDAAWRSHQLSAALL